MRSYAESRDPRTGLYPINLTTDSTTGGSRAKGYPTEEIQSTLVGNVVNIHFATITQLQNQCTNLSIWAQHVCCDRERVYNDEEKMLDTNKTYIGNLARFYIREGMSDMERWHNKLGHVGTRL